MTTPARKWILDRISSQTPSPIGKNVSYIWSDVASDAAKFTILTGVTHDGLMTKWYAPFPKNGEPDINTKGTDPNFTTCTSFLSIMNTKIREAGGLPKKFFHAFNFHNTEKAAFVKATQGAIAKPGDFFLTVYTSKTAKESGHPTWVGYTHHVGVIYEVSADGSMWSQVAGGAGGRKIKKDGVSRRPLEIKPDGLVGWLDVDTYYAGWAEKKPK